MSTYWGRITFTQHEALWGSVFTEQCRWRMWPTWWWVQLMWAWSVPQETSPTWIFFKFPKEISRARFPGFIWQHLNRTGTVVQYIYISETVLGGHGVRQSLESCQQDIFRYCEVWPRDRSAAVCSFIRLYFKHNWSDFDGKSSHVKSSFSSQLNTYQFVMRSSPCILTR